MKITIKEKNKIIAEHSDFKKFYIDDYMNLCVHMTDNEIYKYPFHISTTDFIVE